LNSTTPLGFAVIQNIFENNFTNETTANVSITADSSLNTPSNNVMLWHNTTIGGRMNHCYDDGAGSGVNATPLFRTAWSEIGDLMDQDAIKTDSFAAPASGARVGNWSCLYSVGRRSSLTAMLNAGTTGFAASPLFRPEFPGVQVFELAWSGTNANGTSTTNPISANPTAGGNSIVTTATTMSGATATFTVGSNYASTYTLGNTFSAYGFTPVGYNTTWTITGGGAGTTSLTATATGVSGLGAASVHGSVATINMFRYNNRSAWDGTLANTGYGDYRLNSPSPAINFILPTQAVLPYDFAGQLRNNSGWGSAGAYAQEMLLTPVFGW
jgi:hypothetical protein